MTVGWSCPLCRASGTVTLASADPSLDAVLELVHPAHAERSPRCGGARALKIDYPTEEEEC
jgi:hypothetical protein